MVQTGRKVPLCCPTQDTSGLVGGLLVVTRLLVQASSLPTKPDFFGSLLCLAAVRGRSCPAHPQDGVLRLSENGSLLPVVASTLLASFPFFFFYVAFPPPLVSSGCCLSLSCLAFLCFVSSVFCVSAPPLFLNCGACGAAGTFFVFK